MAVALTCLGEVALRDDRLDEANETFDRALILYKDIFDVGGTATARLGKARAAWKQGKRQAALIEITESLRLAESINFVTMMLSILSALVEHVGHSEPEAAEAIARLVYAHPASDHAVRRELEQMARTSNFQLAGSSDLGSVRRILVTMLGAGSDRVVDHLSRPEKQMHPVAHRSTPGLTAREIEVLRLVAQGKSNRQIADELVISLNTAANHLKSILQKTGSANRTEAAAYARQHDL